MFPSHSSVSRGALALVALLLFHGAAPAQQPPQDVPPLDVAQLAAALKAIRETQAQQDRAAKQRALQDVMSAASSAPRAADLWEEAIRATQFEGASKEAAQVREWREREGAHLNDARVQNALRLYFNWLGLTLKRSAGATPRDLLPAIIAHTKEIQVERQAMIAFEESIQRDKELASSGKNGARDRRNIAGDEAARRLHRDILNKDVNGSVYAQWQRLGPLLKVDRWEMSPGNLDGIYNSIVLPELRAARDPRVIEYWDVKLKEAAENAAKNKLAFDVDRFNQVTRPGLMWGRAREFANIGLRNKAVVEMFTVLKNYPNHPSAAEWVEALEAEIAPPPAAPAPAPAAAVAAPAVPGTPAAPVARPAATAPAPAPAPAAPGVPR